MNTDMLLNNAVLTAIAQNLPVSERLLGLSKRKPINTSNTQGLYYLREKKYLEATTVRWIRNPSPKSQANAEKAILRELTDLSARLDNFAELLLFKTAIGEPDPTTWGPFDGALIDWSLTSDSALDNLYLVQGPSADIEAPDNHRGKFAKYFITEDQDGVQKNTLLLEWFIGVSHKD